MAELLFYRFEFLKNNPGGTYVTGDVVECYYDQDLQPVPVNQSVVPIVVYLNGIVVTSGEYVNLNDPTLVSVSWTQHSICIGTTKVLPGPNWLSSPGEFPYSYALALENHSECQINIVCDLIVVGIPTVVPASESLTADGSIDIVGSSTRPIKYKIGSDFLYEDGTGQTTGDFSGLLPGDYRVYLRDSVNCGVNILVNVPVDNTYGIRFQSEYDDLAGYKTKLEIVKRTYASTVEELCAGDNPIMISLRGEGSTDKFEPLLSISADVTLVSETNLQLSEIFTNDRNLYRLKYYKDFGSGYELISTLKVLPQQYQELYKAPPYYVILTATCGLGELKNFFLVQADGQLYYGTISLIKLVSFCLSKLRLDLPIRCACNLYAVDMSQSDTDDPFDQAYIDFECFYNANKEPNLDFVMRSILEPFGCTIKQWENRWNIVRVEETVSAYDYRDFDKDGEYISNGTFNPVIDLGFPKQLTSLKAAKADHNLELRPGYGQIKVIYKMGLKSNLINNGDFRLKSFYVDGVGYIFSINTKGFTLVNAGYPIGQSFEQLDAENIAYKLTSESFAAYDSGNGGEAYLQADAIDVKMGSNNQVKLTFRYKLSSTGSQFGSTIYSVNVPYTKVRVLVTYGTLYLQSDGSWSDTLNEVVFFENEYDSYVEREVIAKQPTTETPVDGMDFSVRIYQAFAYYTQFEDLATLKAFPTFDGVNKILPDGYQTEIFDPVSFVGDSITYLRLEQNTSADDPYQIIRPDDYHPFDNPRQWVKYDNRIIVDGLTGSFSFWVDRIRAVFLTDGHDPIDAIIRTSNAEPSNPEFLEKELIIGSYSNLIVTETEFSIGIGIFFPASAGSLTITARNILTADLIYTGYLRDVDGVGYEFWARDGVMEEDKLHGIWLRTVAGQYRRSWRLLRGSFLCRGNYFGMLNVVREINDSNRIYMPIALTLNDKQADFSAELMELKNIFVPDGSDGTTESPYSSGFTVGFGAAAFN